MTNEQIVSRLSSVGILGNVLLSVFKLIAGLLGKSSAMVSDAIHSLSDVFATFVAFVGVKMSEKKADKRHPYGHERIECLAALILGVILAATGLGIGYSGVMDIMSGAYKTNPVPTMLPLIAAVVSILSKEGMYRYTMHYAKIMDSAAFKADAWHHRSDAFSSIGALIGIGAARLGFPIMDPIASIVICGFILKVAYDIAMDAVEKMLDTSCDEAVVNELRAFISKEKDVEKIDVLRTRMFSSKIYVDVEISVDKTSSLLEAHDIAERIHDDLEIHFPNVKHVMIHVNPGK